MSGTPCTTCLAFGTECTHKRGPPKGTPRGTKNVQYLVRYILSTSARPYVVPENPEDTRLILTELANRIVYLEEQLEALQKRERNQQNFEADSPESSTMSTSPTLPTNYYYAPAYTPAYVENGDVRNPGSAKEEDADPSTADLVNAVVNQLAVSTGSVLSHSQTGDLEQHLSETEGSGVARGEHSTSGPGTSNAWLYGKGQESAKTPTRGKRKEFWSVLPWQVMTETRDSSESLTYHRYTFPPPDLLPSLISLFFTNAHPIFPVLHKAIFEQGVKEGLHHKDTYFASVLLVVCAIGSRYCSDPRVLEDADEIEGYRDSDSRNNGHRKSKISSGWKWFRQIKLTRAELGARASLYELQMYCLAIYFLQGTSSAGACSDILGIGVRLAQNLGIHRKRPANPRPPVPSLSLAANVSPSAESELWSRAFWGLVSIDVVMCLFIGRPRAIHTDDFDLPLPLACDDEYWEWEGQGDGSPDQEFKQPEDKPSKMIYWVTFLKLLDIMGFAHKNLYAVRRNDMWARNGATEVEWNEKIVAELDSALNAWIDIVPAHLKWNPNTTDDLGHNLSESNPFFHQSTVLYVTYYWAQMIVHKPFLSTISSPVSTAAGARVPGWRFPSMAICTNAAKSVVSLVEIAQRRECLKQGDECRPPLSTTITAVISSAIILFVNVWRSKGSRNQSTSTSFQHLGDVFRCFEILKRWEHTSQSAGRLCDILNGLLPAYGLPSSSSMGPHLARGTRRGRGEDDEGEETSDAHYDSGGEAQDPNLTRMMAAHPRPITGSRRVTNSNFAAPESSLAGFQGGQSNSSIPDSASLHQMDDSGAQPYSFDQSQSQPPHVSRNPHHDRFILLLGSDELGGLVRPKIDRNFVHDYGLGNGPSGTSRSTRSSVNSNSYQNETSFWHGGGGHTANALGSSSMASVQDLDYPNAYAQELLSGAFGNIGPEVFDLYGTQAQAQVQDEGFSTNELNKGTPRGTKNMQCLVKAILSTSRPYVVPENPEDTRLILTELAYRVVYLEERLEALQKQGRNDQTSANSPDSSTTNGSPQPPTNSYTPAYTPTHVENGQVRTHDRAKEDDVNPSTADLVKAVVNQLAISAGPISSHSQTEDLGQHSTDSGDNILSWSGASTAGVETSNVWLYGKGQESAKTLARGKRKEFWSVLSWQVTAGTQDPSNSLTYYHYTFPPPDLLPTLISLFFANAHPIYPVLHKSIFEQSVRDGLHYRDTYFASVLLVVCAIGSRFSLDPRVFEKDDGIEGNWDSGNGYDGVPKSRISAGWKWFRQINLTRTELGTKSSLHELQMYCLAIFFLQGTSSAGACWDIVGIGIRMAQNLGIHRKSPAGLRPPVSTPSLGSNVSSSAESPLWSRAFWALVSIDVVMGVFLGRPRAMHRDDFDLPLPLACDDEYWAWERQTETDDRTPDQDFMQPEDKPSRMSYWVTLLKLLDIMGFAHKTLYAVRQSDMWTGNGTTEMEWNEKIVAELDSELNAWVDTIPTHLKWNPNRTHEPNPFFHQSTVLYVTYYWVQIIIHKPFLSTTPRPVSPPTTTLAEDQVSEWRFPSMSICTNASRSVISLVEIAQRRECEKPGDKCRPPLSTTISAVISSAIILFVNVWRGRGSKNRSTSNSFQYLGDVYRCFEILKRWEHASQVAGRLCDILNGLLPTYGLPSSLSMGSHLARGTRRGRGEDDEEQETSDAQYDSVGEAQNPNLARIMAAHPRPITGSRRVTNSNFAAPDCSLAGFQGGQSSRSVPDAALFHQMHDSEAQPHPLHQPQFQHPHVSRDPYHDQFTLLLGSDELGGLVRPRVERSFVHDYGLGNSTSETPRPAHSSMDPNPYQNETSFWHGGGGHAANVFGPSSRTTSIQDLNHPNAYAQELLAGAFGNIGPEVFDSSYGAQTQVLEGSFSTNEFGPGPSSRWNLPTIDLDEVLRSQSFGSFLSQLQGPS
ncbi:Gypsy retrotransposon integrase-like protein 1 [Marasmius sp. AFHP31]|nr:Gypsy retrotransposon integrase-like protein 1 [Marasmius sp. AFHP31]